MNWPTAELLDAARRVLTIHGFSDSNWATRHSTPGYLFMHGRDAILWASKKQATVAQSSCEAEIFAAYEATKEAIYLRALLLELGLALAEPTLLSMDISF
eukprot:3431562-Pleurochrysis_carterae.AAC.1